MVMPSSETIRPDAKSVGIFNNALNIIEPEE
jgi:hypothetical protein